MEKNFVARIMANIKNFERNINKAQRLAKSSIPREVTTDVDAKIGKFQRAIMKAKAMAQKFKHHTVKVDVDTSAMSKMRKAFGAVER